VYKLYSVGDRMESCGTPGCIGLGVDNSPTTETLNSRGTLYPQKLALT
jgi:hypothetical protein